MRMLDSITPPEMQSSGRLTSCSIVYSFSKKMDEGWNVFNLPDIVVA